MRTLPIPAVQTARFVLVDCGARGASIDARLLATFPRVKLVGFEPDKEECARLNAVGGDRRVVFPVGVGQREEIRTLYITRNPACSSIFVPNVDLFGRFGGCEEAIEVTATSEIPLVALDAFLPQAGIGEVDFVTLDVQGAELEVLRGAKSLLGNGALGIEVEVEFVPIYKDQPLFSDVDSYIRRLGFSLFDLSRARYRRKSLPAGLPTRGQVLWGRALYLRDHRHFIDRSHGLQAMKLAALSAAYGFHDYAFEILDALLEAGRNVLSGSEAAALRSARETYQAALERDAIVKRWTRRLTQAVPRRMRSIVRRGSAYLANDNDTTGFCWFD